MSSTYSPDLRIELIGTGDQAGVWGATTNTNLGTVLEQAIAGYTSVSISSSSQALTVYNGVSDQSRNAAIALTTVTGANFAVYVPPSSKLTVFYNASSYTATIYCSTVAGNTTAAGTGVAIPAGKKMALWTDGTNVYQQSDYLISPTLSSPTMTTPVLGTPASGTLTNCTGLPVSTGVSGLGAGVATFLGTPSSANLAAAVTDETGSGALVFATSPTLVTPALGTPSSATLTNATGLPISTGVSGLGTGIATALAVNVGTAGAPVVNGGVLGTPSSGTLTNATGLPIDAGTTGTLPVLRGGTGVTTSTGSGNNVLSNSPTLVTPALGTPSSATLTNATGLPIDGGTTGTLPVSRGGTGATSISSGALVKAAGTSAFSAASASDIVGQIGSTAVANATYATSAGSATNASAATNATYATSAGSAGSATNATYATSAGSAGSATNASAATNATYASSAGSATNATYATSAGSATNATTATNLANSTGSAPAYACRAWVSFVGNGANSANCTIYGSGNVTSVYKNGYSDYTVYFTTNMADANYSAVITTSQMSSSGYGTIPAVNTYAVDSVRIVNQPAGGSYPGDPARVSVAIFR